MEKKKVRVQIEGRNYTVITEEGQEYVENVAAEVTACIRGATQTGRTLDTRDCAILAAMNFCDDRHKAERRNTELVEKADQIIRQSAELAKQCKEYKTRLAEAASEKTNATELARQCAEYKAKLTGAINENTHLTKRVKALEEQLRQLLRENEALKKNTDSKQTESEAKFEKTVRDKKTEKMMGYVPMRQYSLFGDEADDKKKPVNNKNKNGKKN